METKEMTSYNLNTVADKEVTMSRNLVEPYKNDINNRLKQLNDK